MLNISKYKIKPDFNLLLKTLSGKEKSGKVYSIELLIDEEIRKDIIENYFNERYSPPPFKIFRGTLKGIPANTNSVHTALLLKHIPNQQFSKSSSIF